MSERVVLVPGVGFAGAEMVPLAMRLRKRGYSASVFWHRTGMPALEESARALWSMASGFSEGSMHFVGHSIGGLVVLRMLADHPWHRPGRIMTMATPHTGLTAVRRVQAVTRGRRVLWPGIEAAAGGPPIDIAPERELGVLAGDLNLIFGWMLVPGERNDSLVGVSETYHPARRCHVTVTETHASMLFSRRVADHVESFLREGRFRTSATDSTDSARLERG
jgi:pimeloyl-ACP methyl ester carboxylesterase